MRDLIEPTANSFDLLRNFDVSYSLVTLPVPGIFNPSFVSTQVLLGASSIGNIFTISCTASITNGPLDWTFSNTGLFSGLHEEGSSIVALVPISLSPFFGVNGLTAFLQASASVDGLGLSNEFANGERFQSYHSL